MKINQLLAGALALLLVAGPAAQAQVAPAPQPVPVAPAHERLLPLQGGRNFRDLGGYRTRDGHTVKWGLLFRSGSMHGLAPADFNYLYKLGIRTVCDFRDVHERAVEPVAWPAGKAPTVFADDYDMSQNGSIPKMDARDWTPEKARQVMAATYPRLLASFKGQYQRMFQQLLAGNAPLAFNCTAGKDRTGVAAALLLTALGVPRETVIQDYELTNRYLDAAKVAQTSQATGDWAKLPPPVLKAFMAADPSYIEAVFAVIDKHPGGVDGYLRDEMKLSEVDIARLRRLYLD